jgi:hypothetical protein
MEYGFATLRERGYANKVRLRGLIKNQRLFNPRRWFLTADLI